MLSGRKRTVGFKNGGKMASSLAGKEQLGLTKAGLSDRKGKVGFKKGGKMASSPAGKEQLDLKRVGK